MSTQVEQVDALLSELRAGLTHLYGERLVGVYLFGSFARGEQDSESDLDVLIVLDRVDSYGAEIDRTGDLIARLALAYGLSVSRVFVNAEDWTRGTGSFLEAVRREAILV
jgi:predicted nucleotidyltransferase